MATKTLSNKKLSKEEIEDARSQLREYFKADQRVYVRLLRRSSSGMFRVMSLHIARDNQILNITWLAARALNHSLKDVNGQWGIGRSGCGMDMGFDLVYNLSMVLYCPGKYDHDSAYKLKSEWM